MWVAFFAFVATALALDLGILHKKNEPVRMREALFWSGVWVSLALIFNVVIYFSLGSEKALLFLSAYLIEESLSIDNLFVFLLIFSFFKVPPEFQHRVLFWGILAAAIIRGLFILAGVTLIARFHWLTYLFGGFLVLTGLRMLRGEEEQVHPEKNPVIRLSRRFLRVTDGWEGGRFFVKRDGARVATPLFIVLLVVETTDVVFAVDSVPAVLALSLDPFIVYSSNMFAILGLRSLYFALAGVMGVFHYLHYGLSGILVFVGVKMLFADLYKIPTSLSLAVIAVMVSLGVLASLLRPRKDAGARATETVASDLAEKH